MLRGKWILTNLLGNPPNPPPPNVPALKENEAGAKKLSLRERMEQHRANPACAGCHKVMDPLGFALENFDAVGQWRINDDGAQIDPSGTLFNGAKVDGPVALRKMLTSKPDIFAEVLTEKLMTYALGRGVEYSDMPTVREILRDAARNDYRFSSIVLGIVKSTPFEMKEKQSPEGGSARAGCAAVSLNKEIRSGMRINHEKTSCRAARSCAASACRWRLPLLDSMIPAQYAAGEDGGQPAAPAWLLLHAARRRDVELDAGDGWRRATSSRAR